MNEQLTVQEINTLIEAVDAWTTASQTSSMLAGLFIGALTSRGEGDAEKGHNAYKEMTAGEDEKTTARKEQAVVIKAKLLQMRAVAEAREVAEEMKVS